MAVILLTFILFDLLLLSHSFIINSNLIRHKLKFTNTKHSELFLKYEDNNENSVDFRTLKDLSDRCHELSSHESDYLMSFWSEESNCFQIDPSQSSSRISIVTTCLSINAILCNPTHWANICRWDESYSTSYISLKKVVESITEARWNGDSFQTTSLLIALAQLKGVDKSNNKYINALDSILNLRPRLSNHRNQSLSAYLSYQSARALLYVINNDMIPSINSDEYLNKIRLSLDRSNMIAFDELCRQIAFCTAGDSGHFDVIILAYSLTTYWLTSKNLNSNSFARGVVPQTNINIVELALKIIFSEQYTDGTWRKGEPISGSGLIDNRDIGNSYVFFFDLIESILQPISRDAPELLLPYISNIERCITWAEENIIDELIHDNNNNPRLIKGWRSNHLGTGGAVGWCTAQVFSGLTAIKNLLKILLNASILKEFGGKVASESPNPNPWKSLMDSDLDLTGEQTTLKDIIFNRLLVPQANKEKANTIVLKYSNESVNEEFNVALPLYSVILFGPPGTAKTTICSSIASYLGWNFLVIDTAKFLSNGLEQVANRMTYIFDRLKALDRTIILFDEIEEFCLDRENPNLAMESRLLTTAMLTQLNDLRRQQSSIFIVATNRLRSFDAAVIRPGRFDMVVFVGTPNIPSRVNRLRNRLSKTQLSIDRIKSVCNLFEDVLKKKWEFYRFLTFAENESLIQYIENTVLGSNDLNEKVLISRAEKILRTGTIQGAVRDEFKLSEVLSRI